jgi:biotin synthase
LLKIIKRGCSFLKNRDLIEKLYENNTLSKDEFLTLIGTYDNEDFEFARQLAVKTAMANFDNKIYIRGLIEFTNYCKNNCFYCGIRCGNTQAERYRLEPKEILECCDYGYKIGMRTFVLQGGEDIHFTPKKIDYRSKRGFRDSRVWLKRDIHATGPQPVATCQ